MKETTKEVWRVMDNMCNEEIIKATIEVGKDVAKDILQPTSKSIGENLGLLVDGVMGWLGYWGQKQAIKRDVYLIEYKKEIEEAVKQRKEDNLIEPQLRIVGPTIEASKFYIEDKDFRKMFAELIASSCDKETEKLVHPSFPEIIKQLSAIDARFLQLFLQESTFPCVKLISKNPDNTVTPYRHLLIDLKECSHSFKRNDELYLTQSVDNLIRLGIICLNSEVIELSYDYSKFKEHWYYKAAEKDCDGNIKIKKYRLELTELGEDFKRCCL